MEMVALMPHTGKEEALALAKRLISRMNGAGIEVWLEPEAAKTMGEMGLNDDMADLPKADLAVVLGGDGALLKAARMAAPHGLPILGVNLGHLGFLTAVEPSGLDDAFDRVLEGRYHVEERLMLKASVRREGRVIQSFHGLNDAVITRGIFARVVQYEIFIDSVLVEKYLGDGMIVATPTGSTAYSLSAGGPIVSPKLDAFVLTPICAHTIGARSIVSPTQETVTVRLGANADDAMLTVDGQVGASLRPGDEVDVVRAAKPARLVRFSGRNFYSLLHDRLRSGGAAH